MCSFRGVLELCCFLADERSCGENSDTESTTVGQFVCIFYGHTQSLPEMTFWWTRKSHKFQVDIPALGAKYILSSAWNHICFSRFIRGTAFSCKITDLREISFIRRQTSKLKYVLQKELETIFLKNLENSFTHFILDRSFLLWLTLNVSDWYLRSARHSREALYSTREAILNFNIHIVIFWNHLWVKVAVFCNPVPFRAWLQPIHILKKGLLCDPAMWIISREEFWPRKPPPPFFLAAIMCEGFRTLSPVLFFSSRHLLFVIFVPGPGDTQ